jgi:hypothetical protein
MRNDPEQIAEHLIEQHGVDGALTVAMEGIAAAHEGGDNYGLSVWREVRRALRDKRKAGQESPES